jgi:putative transposase
MRIAHCTLRASDVQAHALDLLKRYVALPDYSASCPARIVYNIILYAASCITSILDACSSLRGAPCEQTLYDALDATLPAQRRLQDRLNRALRATLPRVLRKRKGRKRLPVAVDLTLLPYYGRPKKDEVELFRAARKDGTHTFHAYATAYVCYRGMRFTLACMSVPQGTALVDILKTLLRRVKQILRGFAFVLLDRGFWSAEVIRYLQRARRPFVLPAQYKGRKPAHPKGPSGTYVFRSWRRSGWTSYTVTGRQDRASGRQETARVPLCVKVVYRGCRKRRPGKRKGRKVLCYAVWGLPPRSCAWVRQTYRRRFGIESSYRQMNQARVRTTTRCPVRRLFFVGVALLLRNIWVYLHLEVLAQRTKAGLRLCLGRLRLRVMLRWLQRLLEGQFGVEQEIVLQLQSPT